MATTTPTPSLSPAQRQRLEDEGYLHLPGFFPPAWLDEVDALVAANLKEGRLVMPAEGEGKLFAVQFLSERAPALRPYFWRGPTADLAHELLGPAVRLVTNRYLVKPPHCQEVFPWHRDCEEYANVSADAGVTMWIPLAAATRQNGCLWYVPGSHRAPDGAALPPPVCVPMARGDLALHSLGTNHMTGRNRTAEARAVVALEYIKADARHPETGLLFENAPLLER
ncbi:MAG TPA: phytanoyl-CoA dioxygenase family protein [Polyangiaceae bacterium]|nr:phytanoyl-CoA dioxygenase family protein [Polyangiaceae bacterium]